MLRNTLRLNFCYWKICHSSSPLSSKNNRTYSKNKQISKRQKTKKSVEIDHNENEDVNEK